MKTEEITYQVDGKPHVGFLAYDETLPGPRPGIVIAHAWMGRDSFACDKAIALAKFGYVGFAADNYGSKKVVKTPEEAVELMSPLFTNRIQLRKTIRSAHDELKKLPQVDPSRTGAIGFCFGGLTVLELVRSGADLKGAVSFHGVMGENLAHLKATLGPKEKMKAALLFLHGHDDPLVTQSDILNLQKELTEAGVDWQMHIYGHTMHAFTNPEARDRSSGLVYNALAEKRSWAAMQNFFGEKLI